MPTEVVMPKLGMTMVEGTLAEWLRPDGAPVQAGEPIFRLTTEKIEYEAEADVSGTLRHAVPAETVVAAGGVVALILAPGEAAPAGFAAAAPAPTPPAGVADGEFVRATPAARRLARELGVPLARMRGSGPEGRVVEADVQRFAEQPALAAAAELAEVRASPVARRLAERHGIDLASIAGSGPGGRVVQEDVERAVARTEPAPAAPVAAAVAAGATLPFRGMRRTIADRMQQSLQTMAQLTLSMQVDVTEAVRLRGQLNEEWQPEGVRLTYTDLVIKAAARALREHPRVNASLEGEVIRLHEYIHIGVAVALDEGLIVPVIRDAGRKSLKQIARESSDLAERARAARLSLDDVSGGTFSVTSLGMYEVDVFTPIVNPPQAAILGVGRVKEGLALEGSEVRRRSLMDLSLSFDHRLLDGAPAAAYLRRIKQILERPYLLLVEE